MAAEAIIREAQDYLNEQNPREDGVHVSDLVQCRRKGWYRIHGFPVAPHSTDTLLMFLLGQGHHVLLEAADKEVQLEIEFDGIRVVGHVDKMLEEGGQEFPGEVKTTRAGSKKMKTPTDHYVEQAASYAVMKDTNRARIYVIFLLGDYTGAKKPKIKAWDLVFSDEELILWKREMQRRAKVLAGDEVPSLAEHHKWECNYCEFNAEFGGVCEASGGSDHQWFAVQEDDLRKQVREILDESVD